MKVFILGGTGLIGSAAAAELLSRGHAVKSIALPPLPAGASLPEGMELSFGNALEMSDDEWRAQLAGCDAFVFAAGVDERVEAPPPVYELYRKCNIDPVRRLLALGKECGVRHAVICGSYFSYFAKERPSMRLADIHPYIRSRLEQEEVALSFADADMSVAVLELPYIFGTQPGRKPVWMFLAEMIRNARGAVLYPKGGSAMVTVRQTGEAVAGALTNTKGGVCYPIGWRNVHWNSMLRVMCEALGVPDKKILNIPGFAFTLGTKRMWKRQTQDGIDGGLYLPKLADIMCSEFFIDKTLGAAPLGVTADDIPAAIRDSMRLCADILDGRTEALGMKGE